MNKGNKSQAYVDMYLPSGYNEPTRKVFIPKIVINIFGCIKPVESSYWEEVLHWELDYS